MKGFDIDIEGCEIVPVSANADHRGCLYEIFRQEWAGAFPTVQWNACASEQGVMRGVHVHVDYAEFYTLPMGRVFLGLKDIRRDSPTYLNSFGADWSFADAVAVAIPPGVAHAVYFTERSVLAFGLSDYWKAELDVVGCRWDDPALGIPWPVETAALSSRDDTSGTFEHMVDHYERLRASVLTAETAA